MTLPKKLQEKRDYLADHAVKMCEEIGYPTCDEALSLIVSDSYNNCAAELLPAIENMKNALLGYRKLLDENILVRNIDDDADIMKFMQQGARLVTHLAACQSAIDKLESMGL